MMVACGVRPKKGSEVPQTGFLEENEDGHEMEPQGAAEQSNGLYTKSD